MGEITDLILKKWKAKFSFKVKLTIIIFFIALAFSPGLLLTLPPNNFVSDETDKGFSDYLGDAIMSSKTNTYAAVVHAIVISFVVFLLLSFSSVSELLTR